MKYLIYFFLLVCAIPSIAQHEADTWYFGVASGISFSTFPPTPITSPLATSEGCASLSDSNGILLFYSDGVSIWDKTNTIMPNGTGLNSSGTCTQAALFVPYPGQDSLYYIFTPPDQFSGSLCYSIVDLTLNNGLGDVINKNTPLFSPSAEKITAVRHANGNDIWVIGHSFNNADFYTYQVTSSGINPIPIISTVGSVHQGNSSNKIGYLKASPCGDKLGLTVFDSAYAEIFDFNNSTGLISNPVHLGGFTSSNAWGLYGLEFSPDGTRLYVTQMDNPALLVQYDLSAGSAAAINGSKDTIAFFSTGWNKFSALQLGPDGKIYVGRWTDLFLGCIDSPDSLGNACNFIYSSVALTGASGGNGLPNFMSSYFCNLQSPPIAAFTASDVSICPGECIDFTDLSISSPTAWQWSFPGADSLSSNSQNPNGICYATPGNYTVTLIASNASGSDTVNLINYITVNPFPAPQGIQQSGDTLFANAGAASYQWYYNGGIISGATQYFYVATVSGDYNVVVLDTNGCEVEAVIYDVIATIQSAVPMGKSNVQCIIFPNPIVETSTVAMSMTDASESILLNGELFCISIYNELGEKIYYEKSPLPYNLHCYQYPPGIYLIEVSAKDLLLRGKFVKID